MQIDGEDFHSFISVKRRLAPESIRHCMIRIRLINQWFNDKELNKETVEQYFVYLKDGGRKNNTLNTYYFVFNQLKAYFTDRGMRADFLDGFRSFKKTKPDIVVFTSEEIDKILNTHLTYGKFRGHDTSFLDDRYLALTMFLAFTGCRYSEAAELLIKRVDISAGRATFVNTKTNQNRSVFFTEPLTSRLKVLIEGRGLHDYVFRNAVEKRINVSDYSSDLKHRARAAGITKRTFPHNFRHSYVTHMLESGVPITEVASLVGHKDIQTTYSTYMHLVDQTLKKAAMRHPMVRKNVDPTEIVKSIKEVLENFHLENDPRFIYSISDKGDGLNFELKAK